MEKMEKLISVSPVYYAPKSKELTAKLKHRQLSLMLYKIYQILSRMVENWKAKCSK